MNTKAYTNETIFRGDTVASGSLFTKAQNTMILLLLVFIVQQQLMNHKNINNNMASK